MDALSAFHELEALGAPAGAIYDAACALTRLAEQFEIGKVMRVGEDELKRVELEYQSNSQTPEQRMLERAKLLDSAYGLLLRAFEAGFGDFGQAARDQDLAALRAGQPGGLAFG